MMISTTPPPFFSLSLSLSAVCARAYNNNGFLVLGGVSFSSSCFDAGSYPASDFFLLRLHTSSSS